jgi:type I restriction enzyme, S subunit
MSWEIVALGDVCELYQPKTISTKEMVDDGAYVVFGANGVIGRYDQYNHEDPQLLITCRGATCGSVNVSTPKSWINGNAMVVRPKSNDIDLRFLEYLFRGGVDLSKTITGSAQPQITRQTLAPIEIRYPTSLPEQQRIVGKLDAAFAALTEAQAHVEHNRANARELFESYLNGVFEGKGDGWVEKRLGDLIDIQNGYAFSSNEYKDEGHFLIRISNVQDGEITLANPKYVAIDDPRLKRFILNEGDILVSLTGNIGRVGIMQSEHLPAALNQRVARITLKDEKTIRHNFLFFFLRSNFFREHLQAAGHGAAQQNVSTKEIAEVELSLPPLAEQQRVLDALRELQIKTDKLEATYQQKLTELAGLKKAVLGAAFRGEL